MPTLPSRAARWSNLVAGALLVPVSIGNALGETWSFYRVGAAVETALLVMIIRYAVSWRPHGDLTAVEPAGAPQEVQAD